MSSPQVESLLSVDRSVNGCRWLPRSCDERTALALSQQLEVPDIVGRILAARGVTRDTASAHMSPRLRDVMPDPSVLQDMDRAAERLALAVKNGEGIAVFGDYDVDGGTSAALLERFLRAAGVTPEIYIPDRRREGYGPNVPAMRSLVARGASVIITVDCGTAAHEAIAAAVEAGADVIVVDHHIAAPDLPPAYAVINPNRLDERTELGALAAVGVTYLLVVAANRTLRTAGWYENGRPEPGLLQWLDLVALGTVCDVVALTGLNRALVSQGLKVMAARSNVGLAALADVARMNGPPSAYHAGFVLGPRVNAGGRVGRAGLGAQLLASDDPNEASVLAHELDGYNVERRAIEAQVLAAARLQVEALDDPGPLIFAVGDGWHPGVLGIVASRLAREWRRPSIVMTVEDGIAKGSGRSVPAVDLGAAIVSAKQVGLLTAGGGHPMAAGFSTVTSKVEDLAVYLRTRIAPSVAQASGIHDLLLDGIVAAGAVTPELVTLLEQGGPYGAGNPEPRLAVPSAQVVKADVVGEGHVRVILGGDGGRLEAIAFRSAAGPIGDALLAARGLVHVAGHLRVDFWQGKKRVQLTVDDVAHAA